MKNLRCDQNGKLLLCSSDINLGGIVLTATKVTLIVSLTIIAFSNVTSAQSDATSAPAQSAVPLPLPPMPADANPAFEVATITSSDTYAPSFFRNSGRHCTAHNISVGLLISYAYGLPMKQIVDGPESLLAMHFDVDGVPDIEGHPNLRQTRLMYRRLLVSRFNLAFHYEFRELPAYTIQVAKGGPKLTVTTQKPGDSATLSVVPYFALTARNASIADFAKDMKNFMDKPVVDQTGLKDRYDFELRWTPYDYQTYGPNDPAPSHSDPNTPPGIFTAIQEQLGLKLVPAKARVRFMVIDDIETPSENATQRP
jgi:uncharacterized protein (TIGR03435 family)